MGPLEELTIEAAGRQYSGLRCVGTGTRKALAVHGWQDNAESFRPLAEHLDLGELIAVDMPGHGRSGSAPRGTWYHYADLVWDVYSILRALEWEAPVLIGHSMGATLCGLVAAAEPESVSDLILLDAIGPVATVDGRVVTQLRNGLQQMSRYRDEQKRPVMSLEKAVELRIKASPMLPASAELLVKRATRRTDAGLVWSTDYRLRMPSLLRFSENHVQETLAAIRARALLIVAQQSPLRARSELGPRIAALRGLQVITVPGHHHVHMDSAQSCARMINSFLQARAPD